MLEILPIKDKVLQESVCLQCGVKYDKNLLAYATYSDGKPIGICQFSIKSNVGELVDLAHCSSINHPGELDLMGRAVLNFIDLCGANTVKCENKNIDASLLCSIGFSKKSNGSFEIDLSSSID